MTHIKENQKLFNKSKDIVKVSSTDLKNICENLIKKVLMEEIATTSNYWEDFSSIKNRELLANDYAINIETLNNIIDINGGDPDGVISTLDKLADECGYGWDSNNDSECETEEMRNIWREVTNGGRYPSNGIDENTLKGIIKLVISESLKSNKYDNEDFVKANRKGSRDGEKEIKGVGFKPNTKIHKTSKEYSRKGKQSWKNEVGVDENTQKLYNIIESLVKEELKKRN